MASVGIVVHREREVAWRLASDTAAWLSERGHDVRLPRADAEACGLAELGWSTDEIAVGLDLIVALGGDGTVIRAVELGAAARIPVLGVIVGPLGYLTVVEPEDLIGALKRFLAGSFDVEHRMRLSVEIRRADGTVEPLTAALNEVVVERSGPGHTVRLDVAFDGEAFTSCVADGLIVATPTGSTAYTFSVRGPIVAPRHRAIVLTPVSPHMLFDRSLVLEPDTEVVLAVAGHRVARVSVDGRDSGVADIGDAVVCSAAPDSARLVTFGHRHFHRVLRAKFGLADR